jgi:hypothetical protein
MTTEVKEISGLIVSEEKWTFSTFLPSVILGLLMKNAPSSKPECRA